MNYARQYHRYYIITVLSVLMVVLSIPSPIMGSASNAADRHTNRNYSESMHERQYMPLRPDLWDDYLNQIKTPNSQMTGNEHASDELWVNVEDSQLLDGSIKPDFDGEMYPIPKPDLSGSLYAPQTGTRKTLVIMLQFTDVKFSSSHNAAYFSNKLFGPTNSLTSYYAEQSYGQLTVTGSVIGPYTSTHNISYYAGDQNGDRDSGMYGKPVYVFEMAREAVQLAKAANPSFNWAEYDTDGDGFLDAVTIIHSGIGQEDGGAANTTIWSHQWGIYNLGQDGLPVKPHGEPVGDGTKRVYEYNTVPETGQLGVFCHEFGHVLGLPDLYDTASSTERIVGAGNWDLMASGSWNGLSLPGDCPAGLSAWCRHYMGWLEYTNITADSLDVQIPDTVDNAFALQLWTNGSPGVTHYLVENRQKKGFDQALPGEGLLIWWIDDPEPYIASNKINNGRTTVMPKEADGKATLWKKYDSNTNRGDAGDPFPGSTNNKNFTYTSSPNSALVGQYTSVSVWDIHSDSVDADLMVADVTVNNGLLLEPGVSIPGTIHHGSTAVIEYTLLNNNTTVTMEVFSGSTRVKVLANKVLQSRGTYSITWDGTNTAGTQLPVGPYTIRITTSIINGMYTAANEVYQTATEIGYPVVYGDANQDGSVNITDAVVVLKHITSPTSPIDQTASDVNGDSTINITDAVLILKHITNPSILFSIEL